MLKLPALWHTHGKLASTACNQQQQQQYQQQQQQLSSSTFLTYTSAVQLSVQGFGQNGLSMHMMSLRAAADTYRLLTAVLLFVCCPVPQATPFDPSKSSTARLLSCMDKQCQCGSPACSCRQDQCYYTRHYGAYRQVHQQSCMSSFPPSASSAQLHCSSMSETINRNLHAGSTAIQVGRSQIPLCC
jgi:hypothetical protein